VPERPEDRLRLVANAPGGFPSPFLAIPPDEWIAGNRSGFAVWDRYPVSPGHALVVSRRLIATWWEATSEERADLLALVEEVKQLVDVDHSPDGYNVGFNAGAAAGQTVPHLHLHLIPRYDGDVPDPRGGIRHIIPGRGNYLPPAPASTETTGLLRLFDGLDGSFKLELLRCLWNPAYDRADLVVSFVMRSGLALIDEPLEDALDRGARVRILTTDYLHITDADALARLLDLADTAEGRLETRVFHDDTTSFHPKAYLFRSSDGQAASAFVGSSNLSAPGLAGGVEWNIGVDRVSPMRASFERLWDDPRSQALTADWLRRYRLRTPAALVVPLEVEIEPLVQPAEPRPIQREALDALEHTRLAGYRAGLVVMATGLGKTWLAAFDTARPQFRRILFVAHREEILRQSRDVFRKVQPDGDFGLYYGGERRPDARVVFASVQTLARRLDAFEPAAFDYIVVDEFHHAAASSYRKVLDHFAPAFLLGLTATPERMDGADLLALCGDNLVFQCDLVEGIRRDELVPFSYWGVPDSVDFRPIPWRNGRFDPEALARAVETSERAQQALDEWQSRRGTRTLAFCVSTSHADYMYEFFAAAGVACAAVHSGPTSAPRHQAVEQLRNGTLEVLFSVDLFNEGLDVPEIDTVLMLRPTESPVVFLQQLGRGLRIIEGKERLVVVDFIGNHRSFLLKPRTLLSLGARTMPSTARVLDAMRDGEFDLPPGCSVSYDLTLVDMFRGLVKLSSRDGLEEYCRAYFEEEGIRPSAAQAFRAGYQPSSARAKHGSWFGLLAYLGLLDADEDRVMTAAGEVLAGLEAEPVTKSYKLVTLRALLHDGTLRTGDDVARIAATARQLVLGDPRLLRDMTNEEFPELATAAPDRWADYWRKWPIAAWAGELRGAPGRWFRLDGDRLVPTFAVDEALGDGFDAMAAELVEYRLARYLVGKEEVAAGAWVCKVTHAGGKPIVFLDRKRPGLPDGESTFVADGREYTGNFVKIALNVATLPGEAGNVLPALLRGWFGPSAGHPGTSHQVVFERVDGKLVLRPVAVPAADDSRVISLFPTYDVACGAFEEADWSGHRATPLTVTPGGVAASAEPSAHFLCFARGDSMDGGPDPVRHGDLLLFEWARGVSASDLVGERVLVEMAGRSGTAAALKLLERDGPGFRLVSANPAYPPIPGEANLRVVARLRQRLEQSAINPLAHRIGEPFKREDVAALYGQQYNSGNWQSGHVSLPGHSILFVTLQKSEAMAYGSQYVDHFEGPEQFVWSSQTSVGPDRKKGREILESLDTGTLVHLWVRRRKADVAFVYLGLVLPLSHEGNRPMSVRFRLMTAVPREVCRIFGI
jgi:superfamily II DNA or RNA helicase/diadenosine tetraphosphate (Ap4A) HIT family hydrolase/HKD family nuclease